MKKQQIIFDYYKTLYNPKTGKLFSGTLPLLKNLKKQYSLSLVTTYNTGRQKTLESLGLNSIFDKIVICKKKTLSVFQQLIDQTTKTYIIGDRPEEEIKIGKKLGVTTLCVNPTTENPIKTVSKALTEGIS